MKHNNKDGCSRKIRINQGVQVNRILNADYLGRFSTKPHQLKQLVDVFRLFACQQLMQQLVETLDTQDSDQFRQIVHDLNSAARSVGAQELDGLCQSVKELPDTELLQAMASLVEAIRSAIWRTCDALDAHLTNNKLI